MPRQYDDPNAPHSSSCTRCSYQDKRAQPGNLPERNVLSQIAARWLIKYIHFSIQMVQFQTMLFIVRTSTLSREVLALLLHWWCSYQVLPQRRYAPTKLRAVTYEGNNNLDSNLAYQQLATRCTHIAVWQPGCRWMLCAGESYDRMYSWKYGLCFLLQFSDIRKRKANVSLGV